MPTKYIRKIYLDGLPERVREEVLQDRVEVREETILGLEPRRWAQIAEMFQGESSVDALYCLGRGLNTYAAATYLRTSERTIRNIANRYLDRLRAMNAGAGGGQTRMFADDRLQVLGDDFQFAPTPRAPTRRGRPRKAAEITEPQQLEMDMCY